MNLSQTLFLSSDLHDQIACRYQQRCPENQINQSKALLLTHGLFSSKSSQSILGLESELTNSSLSTLALDLYAHGESPGELEKLTAQKVISSLEVGIQFLIEKEFQEIILYGASMSGFACIEIARRYPTLIKEIILKSPVLDFKVLYQDSLKARSLSESFYNSFGSINSNGKQQLLDCRITVVHGSSDSTVPLTHVEKLLPTLSSFWSLHVIKECDHDYSNPLHLTEMIDTFTKILLLA